ncbi:winged helix-turn-helix transcriptional regulator [Salinirubellus salinus]|uniref:Winged helix-turn-helix transcriptional regulator n=1 Tax=Salinirubellus salinus TaxID=1364945 RepID=A0A9E7U8A3_9EURY|nr:helix-turn-helix domain-containing protein [Salinirubellus salinus]UWM54541.1 winged helix-turn-helix transcriptional regulator [Salinirubellus salinus]
MSQAKATTESAALDSLPPSAKFVHFVLEREPDLTQVELVERTRLSARTVRSAVADLKNADIVDEAVCLRDARKRVYSLTDQ